MRIVLGRDLTEILETGEGREGRHHDAAGSLILKKILDVLKNDLYDGLAFKHRERLA
jgi:hypothetical protein